MIRTVASLGTLSAAGVAAVRIPALVVLRSPLLAVVGLVVSLRLLTVLPLLVALTLLMALRLLTALRLHVTDRVVLAVGLLLLRLRMPPSS